MALAQEPTPPDLTAPPDGGGTTSQFIEDHPRLASLQQFLTTHFQVSSLPTARLDGAAIYNAFLVYLHRQNHPDPPPSRTRFYDDVRSFGIPVFAGTGNRTQLRGLEERPHQAAPLAVLAGQWPDLDPAPSHPASTTQLTRQAHEAIQDTLAITRAIIDESVAKTVQIMRESADEGRQLQAALSLMDRGIPRVKAREATDQSVIDIAAPTTRASLDDVLEVIKRKAVADGEAPPGAGEPLSTGEGTVTSVAPVGGPAAAAAAAGAASASAGGGALANESAGPVTS